AREESRLGLWAPVALGAGAAAYLSLKVEPAPVVAPLLLTAAIAAAAKLEKRRIAALAAVFFVTGFIAADVRAALVAAPALDREIKFATVEGRLVAVDEAPKLRRLIIEVQSIERLPMEATPKRVRLSWRGKEFAARPGDLVAIRASLSPPPEPAAPGGFDFARQLYFKRIGAVGFAVSPPSVKSEDRRPILASMQSAVESLRVDLSRRIIEKAPGDAGAIVAAVVTGKREAISEEAEAAFRDSGLAHLLSISGLHMGLATGLIFFFVRASLALIEPIALTQPIKKWAAIAALASGYLYLMISGGDWPAQRAFVMSAIMFIAIIADRRALSLRNVAIAAFVIILTAPEAVLHPGFQMSFAAVTALIAYYEWASARADPSRSFSWDARLRRYIAGIAITDVIAASATAPFSLFHFNRTSNFGLPANVISIPVMGFWVMPAAIIALLLMPFDADGPVWRIAASGVDLILVIGKWTMNLPGAVTVFPEWPASALVMLTIGGVWLCLMSAPWRLAGFSALPVAIALIAVEPHPDFFISEEGDNVGVLYRLPEKMPGLAVFDKRKGRFDARVWMEQAGIDAEKKKPIRLSEIGACDNLGCVVEIEGATIAVSSDRAGLDDDCALSRAVIALYPVSKPERRNCRAMLIDRRDAWENGAQAAFVSGRGVRIESVAVARGERPWTRR
ncbi:MAG: ComEC/Rec2 family competence protein, partial [Pseudomonadota bacterium]